MKIIGYTTRSIYNQQNPKSLPLGHVVVIKLNLNSFDIKYFYLECLQLQNK